MPPWQALEGEAATRQPLRSWILDLLAIGRTTEDSDGVFLRRDHPTSNHGQNNDDAGGSSGSGSSGSSSGKSTGKSTSSPSTSGDFFCKFCVPDNDARVLYDGLWSLNGAGTFNTTHSTVTAGSMVSFNFNGSGIVVFGTVPSSDSTSKPPTASFTLDADPPFVTTQASADQPVSNQPLFASPKLSEDEHQIVINITSVNARSPFTLDYFLIFPNPSGSNTTSTEATVSFSEPGPSATTPWPSAIAVTNTGTATSKAGIESLQNVVKILSVLMGTLVFLVICLVVFIVWYIRKSRVRRARSRPRSFRSRISRQGTVLTSPESIMRNFTSSMVWSSAGSAAPLSPALPPLPGPEKESRSL